MAEIVDSIEMKVGIRRRLMNMPADHQDTVGLYAFISYSLISVTPVKSVQMSRASYTELRKANRLTECIGPTKSSSCFLAPKVC